MRGRDHIRRRERREISLFIEAKEGVTNLRSSLFAIQMLLRDRSTVIDT